IPSATSALPKRPRNCSDRTSWIISRPRANGRSANMNAPSRIGNSTGISKSSEPCPPVPGLGPGSGSAGKERMQQFNYPTTILFGEGALAAMANRLAGRARHVLLVTDANLVRAGLAARVIGTLQGAEGAGAMRVSVFGGTHTK